MTRIPDSYGFFYSLAASIFGVGFYALQALSLALRSRR